MYSLSNLIQRVNAGDKSAAYVLCTRFKASDIPSGGSTLLDITKILLENPLERLPDIDLETDLLKLPAILYKSNFRQNFLSTEQKLQLLSGISQQLLLHNAMYFIEEPSPYSFLLGYNKLINSKPPLLSNIKLFDMKSYLLTDNDVFIAFSLLFAIFITKYNILEIPESYRDISYLYLYPFITSAMFTNMLKKDFIYAKDDVILQVFEELLQNGDVTTDIIQFLSKKCGKSFFKYDKLIEILPQEHYITLINSCDPKIIGSMIQFEPFKNFMISKIDDFNIARLLLNDNACVDIITLYILDNFVKNPIYCGELVQRSAFRTALTLNIMKLANLNNLNIQFSTDIIEFFHILLSIIPSIPATIPEQYRLCPPSFDWEDSNEPNYYVNDAKECDENNVRFYCQDCKVYLCQCCVNKHIAHHYIAVQNKPDKTCQSKQETQVKIADRFIMLLIMKLAKNPSYTCSLYTGDPKKYSYKDKNVIQRQNAKIDIVCYDFAPPRTKNEFICDGKTFSFSDKSITNHEGEKIKFNDKYFRVFHNDKQIFVISSKSFIKFYPVYEKCKIAEMEFARPKNVIFYKDYLCVVCAQNVFVLDNEASCVLNSFELQQEISNVICFESSNCDFIAISTNNAIFTSPILEPALIVHAKFNTDVFISESDGIIIISTSTLTQFFTYDSFISKQPFYEAKIGNVKEFSFIKSISSYLLINNKGFVVVSLYDQRMYIRAFEGSFTSYKISKNFVEFYSKFLVYKFDFNVLINPIFKSIPYRNPYPLLQLDATVSTHNLSNCHKRTKIKSAPVAAKIKAERLPAQVIINGQCFAVTENDIRVTLPLTYDDIVDIYAAGEVEIKIYYKPHSLYNFDRPEVFLPINYTVFENTVKSLFHHCVICLSDQLNLSDNIKSFAISFMKVIPDSSKILVLKILTGSNELSPQQAEKLQICSLPDVITENLFNAFTLN